jgi:RNA polymerase sigma factor (TIGR02999 family)
MSDSLEVPSGTPAPAPFSAPVWDSVYRELRALAASYLARDQRSHTLQPTALVHETFLRLQGSRNAERMDRLEFYRAAASAMRRVLIDYARYRQRQKRGRGRRAEPNVDLDSLQGDPDPERLLELEDALAVLESLSPRRAEVVRLRFFAGLSEQEVADLLGTSRRTVQYDFRTARAWLRSALGGRAVDERSEDRGEGVEADEAPR